MILVIDCFKLVKGSGKSIGIYNLALNLVRNLVTEQQVTNSSDIKTCEIIVLGNEYNRVDFEIEGVRFVKMNLNPANKIVCILWELFFVPFVCKKMKADRVVFPRGFASLFHFIKESIIVHDLIPFYYNEYYPEIFNRFENAYIMNRLKASIKKSNQIMTISEASKQEIIKLVPKSEKKIKVIHNGCNQIDYHECNTKKNYIVAMTSALPHKNAKGIVESYKNYCEKVEHPLPLTIIGIENVDGYELKTEVKKQITCIKFVKNNREMHEIIANAELFLFLSLVEGFGFPPLEAMQLGTPVICSNLSSLPEVVADAAVLVSPTQYEEVADAIINLITNKDKKKELISRGYENCKRFSWEKQAKQYWQALVQK